MAQPDPQASLSVDPLEIAKFDAMADEWWDPAGKFAPLHKFNPCRLAFIRETAAGHFGRDSRALAPFQGLSLLDIGCGGGLLSEPMGRMGFAVLGVDPSEKNVAIASVHASRSTTSVHYRASTAEALATEGQSFDVILNMEVVEHVADLASFLQTCSGLLKPQGLMFVATLNKTLKSLALAKIGAEYVLGWLPRGTHDWSRFVEPPKLCGLLEESGLKPLRTQGVAFNPFNWDWQLSDDVDVNYMVVATRG
jgi:2-polyprenyl-6-hydroxyphenyl methylase/3-demethylubiquinone-9 3-methyltransferase